jgi:hypothetical protein
MNFQQASSLAVRRLAAAALAMATSDKATPLL